MKLICQHQPCSKEFESDNPNAMYHSPSCRVMACRAKKKPSDSKPKSHGRPQKPAKQKESFNDFATREIVKIKKIIEEPLIDKAPDKALADPIRSVLDKLPQYKH